MGIFKGIAKNITDMTDMTSSLINSVGNCTKALEVQSEVLLKNSQLDAAKKTLDYEREFEKHQAFLAAKKEAGDEPLFPTEEETEQE